MVWMMFYTMVYIMVYTLLHVSCMYDTNMQYYTREIMDISPISHTTSVKMISFSI